MSSTLIESCAVENYLDKFQTLMLEANYTNSCTIEVKFCYRLKIVIQNQITTLPIERPKDTSPLLKLKLHEK